MQITAGAIEVTRRCLWYCRGMRLSSLKWFSKHSCRCCLRRSFSCFSVTRWPKPLDQSRQGRILSLERWRLQPGQGCDGGADRVLEEKGSTRIMLEDSQQKFRFFSWSEVRRVSPNMIWEIYSFSLRSDLLIFRVFLEGLNCALIIKCNWMGKSLDDHEKGEVSEKWENIS